MQTAEILAPLVARLREHDSVEAVALIGSRMTGMATDASDIDLFVYVREPGFDDGSRHSLADSLADGLGPRVVADPPYAADAWVLRGTSLLLDIQYWPTSWAEDELDWRLVKQSPQHGFSTCFWRSIREGVPLYERTQWHQAVQQRATARYPDGLRSAIIDVNRRALGRDHPFSIFHQAATAIETGDVVNAQRKVSQWLANYFDVLFAANRTLHPGEKRLIVWVERECSVLPDNFRRDVERLVESCSQRSAEAVQLMEVMVARLDEAVRSIDDISERR